MYYNVSSNCDSNMRTINGVVRKSAVIFLIKFHAQGD
ncbi:hypothetical protein CF65_01271 [Aggregatibacter actinomycetemcomitans HK1651]|nr:hypothetical protein CF65_01271 [Aggregatibacter actinomycetemcomitans HK1651]